jgi:general secretion pathway protein K
MYQNRSLAKQQGVALIIVLLILALMVSIAAVMSERLFRQFQRANHQVQYQQAYWYGFGAEALAKEKIKQSYRDNDDSVNLSQPWAAIGKKYPVEGGTIEENIFDKQGCFNINILSSIERTDGSSDNPYPLQVLQHLMESSGSESYQAESAAEAVWEYIDTDKTVNTNEGVEDSYYESMSPSYVAADTLLADASELRAVKGVSGDMMLRILPSLCALPSDEWKLNINTISTAQAPLLAAMFYPYLSTSAATQLIERRPHAGWDSLDDFMAESELASIDDTVKDKAKAYLGIDSSYFELDALVTVSDARMRLRSLLYSEDRENVTVIRRRYGGERERIPARQTE